MTHTYVHSITCLPVLAQLVFRRFDIRLVQWLFGLLSNGVDGLVNAQAHGRIDVCVTGSAKRYICEGTMCMR